MTSKIKYYKNYTELGQTYQLVLPLSLEGLVPDDDPDLCLFKKHLFYQMVRRLAAMGEISKESRTADFISKSTKSKSLPNDLTHAGRFVLASH